MLESVIRQHPELFNNVAKHWHMITGAPLLLFNVEGLPVANPARVDVSPLEPVITSQISGNGPAFLPHPPALIAPIVYKNQTEGYLFSPNVTEHYKSLLRWVVDDVLERVIDFYTMQSMTDELIGAWDQLELIFRVTDNLALTTDLTSVLKSILLEVKKVAHTEDGFILLDRPDSLLCVTMQETSLQEVCSPNLLHTIGDSRRITLHNTPESCRQFWVECPATVQNLLVTPLVVPEDEMQAAFGLINKTTRGFNAGDVKLLAALAQQLSTIINNHLTHHKLLVKERISRELEIAAEIQESLLPKKLPQMGGISMSVSATPASEVGGDFYDFITLDDRHLTIVMGDVSGKGIPAAMLTSVTRTMLRVEAMRGEPPHKIIQLANNLLYPDLSRAESFVTVFVATLDTYEGKLTYASAGHTPVLLWRAKTQKIEQLKATSLPIGIFNLPENRSRTIELGAGDTLVLYTDGITEAQSPNQDFFGLNRLSYIVESRGGDPPEALQQFIQAEVNSFRRNAAWQDDATLLVLKTLTRSESSTPQNISTVVKTINFNYPANMDYLSEISQKVASSCRELSGLPGGSRGDDFIYLIELAISEICTNIVKHAYAHSTGHIKGQVTLLNNGVQLDIYDTGKGFDPNTIPQPQADPNNLREGGYGLHIVRQIMDVVSYECDPDDGNHWHLIKFLPSQK